MLTRLTRPTFPFMSRGSGDETSIRIPEEVGVYTIISKFIPYIPCAHVHFPRKLKRGREHSLQEKLKFSQRELQVFPKKVLRGLFSVIFLGGKCT